jgi:hypothetical protein
MARQAGSGRPQHSIARQPESTLSSRQSSVVRSVSLAFSGEEGGGEEKNKRQRQREAGRHETPSPLLVPVFIFRNGSTYSTLDP